MLCCTLCPAFLIAIPSAMQWSITVAQISSEITVLCSLLWQLPSSTTLNTHCSLYNLQLLALSKLAYIGVLASIATRVNNFCYLCLPLCNTKCITVSIQPCFQSSKEHVNVMMGWKHVEYYIICVSFVKILFYDFHHILNSFQLIWKFMQENSWVGPCENRKWRCSARFLSKQEVLVLPKTFNDPCNFSNSECWFSEMIHFVKCCRVLWNVRFCKVLYFMKCCV